MVYKLNTLYYQEVNIYIYIWIKFLKMVNKNFNYPLCFFKVFCIKEYYFLIQHVNIKYFTLTLINNEKSNRVKYSYITIINEVKLHLNLCKHFFRIRKMNYKRFSGSIQLFNSVLNIKIHSTIISYL